MIDPNQVDEIINQLNAIHHTLMAFQKEVDKVYGFDKKPLDN